MAKADRVHSTPRTDSSSSDLQFKSIEEAENFLKSQGFRLVDGTCNWTNDDGDDAGVYSIDGRWEEVKAWRVEINRRSEAPTGDSPKPAEGLSRRRALVSLALLPAALPVAAAAAAAGPIAAPAEASQAIDPIFAALDAWRRADAACVAIEGDIPDELGDRCSRAHDIVLRTRPTTPEGLAALTSWARERADWLNGWGSYMLGDDLCTLAATIDDATRGMAGLEPWSPPQLYKPTPSSSSSAANLNGCSRSKDRWKKSTSDLAMSQLVCTA